MILLCPYWSYWVLCSAVVKTLIYFVHLLERQHYFIKFYNVNTINTMHIFIQLYTSLIHLSKATWFYMIIWQTLYYAVKQSLSIVYCTLQISCQWLMKIVFTSHEMKSIKFLESNVSKILLAIFYHTWH